MPGKNAVSNYNSLCQAENEGQKYTRIVSHVDPRQEGEHRRTGDRGKVFQQHSARSLLSSDPSPTSLPFPLFHLPSLPILLLLFSFLSFFSLFSSLFSFYVHSHFPLSFFSLYVLFPFLYLSFPFSFLLLPSHCFLS